jgi:GABA(A) receptor-associated protein
MFKFKSSHSFEKRKSESLRIRSKYPDKIPIIVEKFEKSNTSDIDKNKYLVPSDLTVGQFLYVIRKRIQLLPEKAIYLFIDNKIPATAQMMINLYEQYKDDDGFLYIFYACESTFG